MKKTVLTTLALSLGVTSSVMAAALPQGGATLQWAGSVPPVTVNGAGYYIVKEGAVEFSNGLLTFTNDASGAKLQSASEIGFRVVKDESTADGAYNSTVDINPMKYQYTLVDVKVGINGLASSQDPSAAYFGVYADGASTPLNLNSQSVLNSGEPTRLTIKANSGATTPSTLTDGADVVVMSVLTVTPDDTAI